MLWYMDGYFDRCACGTEVIGGIHRWVLKCNWKFAAEQFCSDMYHADFSHLSALIAQLPEGVDPAMGHLPTIGSQFSSRDGHGTGFFTETTNTNTNFNAPVAAPYYDRRAQKEPGERHAEPRGPQTFCGQMTAVAALL